MNTPKDGGPAFPLYADGKGQCPDGVNIGMSLRDWFAGMALQTLIPRHDFWNESDETAKPKMAVCALAAYQMANAMLAEREKGMK